MKDRILNFLRKAMVSVFVSAGILSIANVDSVWREAEHQEKIAKVRLQKYKESGEKITRSTSTRTAAAELRDLIQKDEILGGHPFRNLSTPDPLNRVLAKKITGFERQTYRSPHYLLESGYDLIHYSVQHDDGSKSSLLAFTDKNLASGEVEAVVHVIRSEGELAKQSTFRTGTLIEQTELPLLQAEEQVAQRISQGVPFLAVAR